MLDSSQLCEKPVGSEADTVCLKYCPLGDSLGSSFGIKDIDPKKFLITLQSLLKIRFVISQATGY